MVEWIVLQFLSYSLLNWLLFVGIAFSASYFGGCVGIFMGHFLVAFAVWALDIEYALSHEYMDMDIVFTMGVIARVLSINTALLPVSFLGLSMRRMSVLLSVSFMGVLLRKIRRSKTQPDPVSYRTSPTTAQE